MKLPLSATTFAIFLYNIGAVKVAFLGDTDNKAEAVNTFQVIRDNKVDIVVQNGDFDYDSNPGAWDDFLAQNWPVSESRIFLATSGNHEDEFSSTASQGGMKWEAPNGYKERLFRRLQKTPSFLSSCKGRRGRDLSSEYGNFMACEKNDILLITVGWRQISDKLYVAGGDQSEVNSFLEDVLSNSKAKWKVCTWHRPEGSLNPGSKFTKDYNTQAAYNACAKYGAFITTGHSHVYGRSKLLENFNSLQISSADDADELSLSCGRSFSIVTGMGGRDPIPSGPNAQKPWMRKFYTASVGAVKNGVLICDFKEKSGLCNFHLGSPDIPNHIFDSFKILPPPPNC